MGLFRTLVFPGSTPQVDDNIEEEVEPEVTENELFER